MRFSRVYPKLQDRVFTTIRAGEPFYHPGMKIVCETPTETFSAEVLFNTVTSLVELPLSLLRYDIGEQLLSRKEITDLYLRFYRDRPDPAGDWTLYILRRMEQPASPKTQG